MISNEQIDTIISTLGGCCDDIDRKEVRLWLSPILAAERNRLLDEIIKICEVLDEERDHWDGSRVYVYAAEAIIELKCRIETLRSISQSIEDKTPLA